MDIDYEKFEPASKMMEAMHGNCAQAIFAKFGPSLSDGRIDAQSCMRITSAFGGGINRTGNVCGAVTGALMALGLKYGDSIQDIAKISYRLIDEFTEENGSIICRDIIGHNKFDDEDLRDGFEEELFKKCKNCVDSAALLVEKYITESEVEAEKKQ